MAESLGILVAFFAGVFSFLSPCVLPLFRRAATYVDKILKGAKPANLPVQ